MRRWLFAAGLAVAGMLSVSVAVAQDAPPPAEIVNDEGGAVVIRGQLDYSNLYFTSGLAEPLILLEDHAGFVQRDFGFIISKASQVLGQFTSDIFSPPVSYSIPLPIEPQATLVDVDNDDQEDIGVMIYSIAFWANNFGDPYLEPRDGGVGWSGDYASFLVDPGTLEVLGGKYLIYAPDDQQGFPAGFGEDGLLFTEDDPIVTVPQGYTVVDLDTDPFTFDRSREPQVNTIESPLSAAFDVSDLSYTEAFDAFVDHLEIVYAFTEYKNIDWEALSEEFRPRIEEAQANGDNVAYELAIRDFSWAIPDGHIGVSSTQAMDEDFAFNTAGGLGMSLVELDDGRVLVNFLTPEGPADAVGIELGAEITELDGKPISDVIGTVVPYSSPFSNPEALRLQQLRYTTRFPLGTEVQVTWVNPGEEPATETLDVAEERESFAFSSFYRGATGFEPPVTYDFLDSGYGYVKINDFLANAILTVQLFENFLNIANTYGVPGIIIDMRQNGGGSGLLADSMAGYFFDEDFVNGYTSYYSESAGDFVVNADAPSITHVAPENQRYSGEVVVLVGPACASACEFFSYNLTHEGRATVIGQYPTAGLGASVNLAILPEGITFNHSIGRGLDENQQIHIETTGVVPDIDVPVDETTIFAEDPVLDAAIAHLDESLGFTSAPAELTITEGGAVAVGETIDGTISAGERINYTLSSDEDVTVTISLSDADGSLDTYLRILDVEGNVIAENDDIELGVTINSLLEGIELVAGDAVIVQVGTYDDAAAGDYTLSVTAE
jgi:C-terminal processing protease CtpA/Prc/opacity protein-like surface antigen